MFSREKKPYDQRGPDERVRGAEGRLTPAWSPDSRTLPFVRREYTADYTDLWTVNVDGRGGCSR